MRPSVRSLLSMMVAAAAAATSSAAVAVVFDGTAVGSWTNPVGFGFTIDNSDVGGVASVEWGAPASGSFSNRFMFDGVGSDGGSWSSSDETPFLVGDFTYRNGSVFSSSHNFTSVDLSILLTITSPIGVSDSYGFEFDITNTPNTTGNPVLDGDIVTVASTFSPTTFTYDSVEYTLALLGFSSDGGSTIRTDFSSPENATASAGVYGKITAVSVPEPTTLTLMGIGLAGLAWTRRRKRLAA